MSTRYLIAAILMTSACVAQADVLPTGSTAQSSFLSGWTTSNGSNVVNSGTLVGGVAYGSDNATLVKALYDKASASAGQAGGDVNLSLSQGIEGTYVVGTSNAIMAAMLGNGVSVVNTADGKKITTGAAANATAAAGGGSFAGGSIAGGGSVGASAGGSTGGSAGGSAATDGAVGGTPIAAIGDDPSVGGNGGNINTGIGAGGSLDINNPVVSAPLADAPGAQADASEVPEPSSIALMMAGMVGALALGRRRRVR
jgi:hypothetical protein